MLDELTTRGEAIAAACRRFGVLRLSVFGSAATDDTPDDSDVDLLVDFDPASPLSRFEAFFSLKEELKSILHRPVDLVTSAALENPYFAASVERLRHELYAA